MEIRMRNSLQEIYFGKTKDIINSCRTLQTSSETKAQDELRKELLVKMKR